MKTICVCCLFLLLIPAVLKGQAEDEGYQFGLLRQHDDLRFLAQKEVKTRYDRLKYQPLGTDAYLSLGGSYRGQYEHFYNDNFRPEPAADDGWYLQRLLLHADFRYKRWQVFAELNSSLTASKQELSPVDQDELSFNQVLLRYDAGQWGFRLGRENLKLGSRRLVDLREGPNVRRAFDHAELYRQLLSGRLRLFYGQLVDPRPGVFDNPWLHHEQLLWGLYWERQDKGDGGYLEPYYLGFRRKAAQYLAGTGDETRHSFGLRYWGRRRHWEFDHEAILQTGSFGERSILAWTVSLNASYALSKQQRLGLKTELISGDDADTESLGTFNPLFPRGAYFGRVAKFGPLNLIDLHPYWNIRLGQFFIEIDYDVFWRFSLSDGVYGPAGTLDFAGQGASRRIAHQIGTLFSWEPAHFLLLELETNYIKPSNYLVETGNSARLWHVVFTGELRF